MIKILHLITDLQIGGAEIMLLKLIGNMKKNKFTNVVVSLTDYGTIGSDIERQGIKVYYLKMKRGLPNLSAFIKLFKVLKQEKPDILQTWLYHADLMGSIAYIIYTILNNKAKLVWNIRCSDMDFQKYPKLTKLVVKACSRLSGIPEAVIVNSQAGRNAHQNMGYRPKTWKVIPNGFDTDIFKPNPANKQTVRGEMGIDNTCFVIGMVARYDPMKDHKTFLEAAYLLNKNTNKKVKFILVGKGIDSNNVELMKIIRNKGLESQIYLLGERRDIPRIMSAFDLYTSSSRSEGFPNVIGEAMSCALPCIVTAAGDSAQIVGGAGKVVPIMDPISLCRGWLDFIGMTPKEREIIGEKARQRIIDLFSLPSIVFQYEKFYEEILLK